MCWTCDYGRVNDTVKAPIVDLADFDLAVHHDAAKGVVVLEYASDGHVVGTGRRYSNRYIGNVWLAVPRCRGPQGRLAVD